jgi:hypothetical protein
MKLIYFFTITFLLFFGLLLFSLETFFSIDKTTEKFVPDIGNHYIDFFFIFPVFLIFSIIISGLKLHHKNKVIFFIINILIFLILFLFFLPNRDLRLWGQ